MDVRVDDLDLCVEGGELCVLEETMSPFEVRTRGHAFLAEHARGEVAQEDLQVVVRVEVQIQVRLLEELLDEGGYLVMGVDIVLRIEGEDCGYKRLYPNKRRSGAARRKTG